MKTIADYQPDPLIRHAITYLASLAQRREIDQDAMWLIEVQVAHDIARQEIYAVRNDEITAWVAQAVAGSEA